MLSSRQAILDGVLARFPHEDIDSLEEQAGRYAIIQRFSEDDETYWYDLADDVEQGLTACANDYIESKYIPFLIVDLDSGACTEVELAFRLGDVSSEDFSHFSSSALDRSPRGRASVLAENAQGVL